MLNYTRNMHQIATYWPPGGNDGFGGHEFGTPRQLRCRWQEAAELFRDAQGRETTSSAVVYPAEPVEVGGYLHLGVVADANPTTITGPREVRQIGASPDLHATKQLNKAWL